MNIFQFCIAREAGVLARKIYSNTATRDDAKWLVNVGPSVVIEDADDLKSAQYLSDAIKIAKMALEIA